MHKTHITYALTEAKRQQSGSPYQHLLPPKAGGFRTVVRHSPEDATVCDMTVVYRAEQVTFWRCLGGLVPRVDVYLHRRPLTEVRDVRAFLTAAWHAKDELMVARIGAGQPATAP